MTTDRTLFALALLHIDGVGRVTAGRLLTHFHNLDDLHRYPREQVLHRIKSVRNGEALVNNLFDEDFLEDHLSYARAHAEKLAEREIEVIVQNDERWPAGFSALDSSNRPVLLYTYGNAGPLNSPRAAVFAQPPLAEAPFEWAQDLARELIDRQVTVITGVAHGFDSVLQKLCTSAQHQNPSIMIANCGLAKIPTGLRSIAGQAVRSGSLMISSFPMGHGPYKHDDYERALLQTALADLSVFIEPHPDTPEWRAMKWALQNDRTTYILPHGDHEPPTSAASISLQTPVQDVVLSTFQS